MLDHETKEGVWEIHRIETVPSENSTPSATMPVPEMPDTSISRCI
jgi:hypothetical protein